MNGLIDNVETFTLENQNKRDLDHVLYTNYKRLMISIKFLKMAH